MTEPILRPATVADDEAIAACIGEAFPDNPKSRVEVLRWQYRANPFGPTASWVWDDGGRIVAHYSAFPMPYLLDGRPVIGANAVDAAVVPSHQGQRLFSPMARALYDDCAAKGMPVAVCYASNPIAMRGVAKAGVQWMPRLRTSVLALDPAWVGRRFHLPRPAARLACRVAFGLGKGEVGEEIHEVPDGLDALWARFVRGGRIFNGVDRGEAWWRWRYLDSPLGPYRIFAVHRDGRLVGAAAVVVRDDFGGRFGYLLELVADRGTDGQALLRAIAATIDGLSGLAAVAVERSALHKLLMATGMPTLPTRLEPKGAWYGIVATAGGVDLDQDWHIGWGDLDHL